MINIDDKEKPYKTYDHQEKMERGIHFTIDYNGNWYFHNGASAGPIRRQKLAALFGGAGEGFMAGKGLFIDDEGLYWLKSPDGQYQVEVEDVPFIITRFEVQNPQAEDQQIDLYTNFDEYVPLGADHPLIIGTEPEKGVEVFYVEVRKGLKARFSKTVFHDIVTNHVESAAQSGGILGNAATDDLYILRSRSEAFEIKLQDFSA